VRKHERIQKIKESPEWNWYQERLNLMKDEDTRFHMEERVMSCFLNPIYKSQLTVLEEQLEQTRMNNLYGEFFLENHFDEIDEKVKSHPYFSPHNPNKKEEN
jgi:hypothetical protein